MKGTLLKEIDYYMMKTINTSWMNKTEKTCQKKLHKKKMFEERDDYLKRMKDNQKKNYESSVNERLAHEQGLKKEYADMEMSKKRNEDDYRKDLLNQINNRNKNHSDGDHFKRLNELEQLEAYRAMHENLNKAEREARMHKYEDAKKAKEDYENFMDRRGENK